MYKEVEKFEGQMCLLLKKTEDKKKRDPGGKNVGASYFKDSPQMWTR